MLNNVAYMSVYNQSFFENKHIIFKLGFKYIMNFACRVSYVYF